MRHSLIHSIVYLQPGSCPAGFDSSDGVSTCSVDAFFNYVHEADNFVCKVWLTSSYSMPSSMLDAIGLHEFGCTIVYSVLTASSGLTHPFLYEFS